MPPSEVVTGLGVEPSGLPELMPPSESGVWAVGELDSDDEHPPSARRRIANRPSGLRPIDGLGITFSYSGWIPRSSDRQTALRATNSRYSDECTCVEHLWCCSALL